MGLFRAGESPVDEEVPSLEAPHQEVFLELEDLGYLASVETVETEAAGLETQGQDFEAAQPGGGSLGIVVISGGVSDGFISGILGSSGTSSGANSGPLLGREGNSSSEGDPPGN